jgi:hypothetical protein
MLGLRPRLKARPSFLDLVRKSNAHNLAPHAAVPQPEQRVLDIPLPPSPPLGLPDIVVEAPPSPIALPPPTMPPVCFDMFRTAYWARDN